MFLSIFLCSTLIVTSVSVQSGNSTPSERAHNGNVHNTDKAAEIDLLHKPNVPIVSEGGTSLPNPLDISLPKQHENSLLSLEEESVKTKEKNVVARKGVDIKLADTNTDANFTQSYSYNNNNNNSTILLPEKPITASNKSSTISVEPKDNHASTALNNTVKPKKIDKTPTKPTILSYEAIANMEKKIQSNQSKTSIAPSTKIVESSPLPKEQSIVKVHLAKANNSHPGMIMPIVITILVVPMFAIVGYMALRRGQEAWKNRHYKRMDFLLDGMYND